MPLITYREAVRHALAEELERDANVVVMGEEVAQFNGAYKVTEGLLAKFGPKRIVDTPISEAGFIGMGIGTLFGRPVYTTDYAPEFTGTTAAANILVVGDFSNFVVAQRAGMSVELIPHLFGATNSRPTNQRGFFATARHGFDSVNDLGFRLLQNQ